MTPVVPRNFCVDCEGNGKCSECSGTGVNTHLNELEPNCRKCKGTGLCPECRGTGRWYVPPPEIQDLALND